MYKDKDEHEDIRYEREGDEPKYWETNVIYVRNSEGKVTRISVENSKGDD